MSLFWDKFCRSRPVEHNLTTILPPHAGSRTRDSTPICKRNVGSLNRSTFESGLCTQDGSHGLCRGWTPFPEHYQHRVPVDPCSPCWGAKCWRKGVKERLVRAFPLSWFSTSLSFEVRACQSRQSQFVTTSFVPGSARRYPWSGQGQLPHLWGLFAMSICQSATDSVQVSRL